jgi:hypothetical protein
MVAISGIEGVVAPQHSSAHAHQEKQSERTPVNFGGAVTHSEMVEAKLRVDPAALAARARASDAVRQREEPPRESSRERRFAADDAARDAQLEEGKGEHVDISV